jgi:hypothetical protein
MAAAVHGTKKMPLRLLTNANAESSTIVDGKRRDFDPSRCLLWWLQQKGRAFAKTKNFVNIVENWIPDEKLCLTINRPGMQSTRDQSNLNRIENVISARDKSKIVNWRKILKTSSRLA